MWCCKLHVYIMLVKWFIFLIFVVAEMASGDEQVYQSFEFVSASIKVDYPHAKYFTATFTENGFSVSADG